MHIWISEEVRGGTCRLVCVLLADIFSVDYRFCHPLHQFLEAGTCSSLQCHVTRWALTSMNLFLLSDVSFCCVVVFHVYLRHAHHAVRALCMSHRIFSIIHAAYLQQHPGTCRPTLIKEAPPLASRPDWSCSHPSRRVKEEEEDVPVKTQLGFI